MTGSLSVQQVVEIRAEPTAGSDKAKRGSGYLIGDDVVLTAAHVVFAADGTPRPCVWVQSVREEGWVEASVVWPARRDAADVALLHVTDAGWRPPPGRREVGWGRFTGQSPVAGCQTLGFPRVLRELDGRRQLDHLTGRVNPGAGARDTVGRFDVHLDGAPPAGWPEEKSAWAGLSGAAVFAGGLLTGVVILDVEHFAGGRLAAVPISAVAHDPGFAELAAAGAEAAGTATVTAGAGDAVRGGLYLGSVELDRMFRPPEPVTASPAGLLKAERAVVRFRGGSRHDILDDLATWCVDDDVTGVGGRWCRLVVGPGGQGKTRLAVELIERMRARSWVAGVVDRDADLGSADANGLTLPGRVADSQADVLLVVDYAESRGEHITSLVRAVAAVPAAGRRARLLLLARGAGGWWEDLRDELDPHLTRVRPTVLTQVDDEDAGRRDAFTKAVADIAADLATIQPGPDWPRLAADVEPPPMAGPRFATVLAVQLEALVAVLQAGPDPVDVDEGDAPEDTLLRHERRYWAKTARGRPGLNLHRDILRAAVTTATVCGAANQDEALATARRVLDRYDERNGSPAAVADWLADLYPPAFPDRFWGGLQPDRIGEHLLRVVADADADGDLLPAVLAATSDGQLHQAVEVIGRAARTGDAISDGLVRTVIADPGRIAPVVFRTATQASSPEALVTVIRTAVDVLPAEQVMTVLNALPHQTVSLANLAVDLTHHLAIVMREAQAEALLALSLNNLGVRLANVGRRAEALAPTMEATDIYRRLVEAAPDAYLPDLAMSLNNLGLRLAEVGRRAEALAPATEAADIRRRLAEATPDAYLPDLATSLNNLANRLAAVGRHAEALASATEAAALYRHLADAYLPDLAMALNNLANHLTETGRHAEALASATEAAALYRHLAGTAPDAYLPDLATSLNNLANHLAETGRHAEALAPATEAADIQRRLAEATPDAYLPDLATSLNNLGIRLAQVGRHAEALAPATEAADIRRRLAEATPDAYLPDLATSLNNLGIRLAQVGRRAEALHIAEESVEIYSPFAGRLPAVFRQRFSRACALAGSLALGTGATDKVIRYLLVPLAAVTEVPEQKEHRQALLGVLAAERDAVGEDAFARAWRDVVGEEPPPGDGPP